MTLFYELMQIATGYRDRLSHIPNEAEWKNAYNEAILQAIAGICFTAIQKLPQEQRPPKNVYWEWLGLVTQIQQQNELMDRRTAEIWRRLKDDGFDAAILKGQGIATLYNINDNDIQNKLETWNLKPETNIGGGRLGAYRQSGDIDIWVKGGYQKVCDYVQRTHPTKDLAYHRFHYDFFKDTEVELHHRPTLMRNLFDDRKLAKWYNSFDADSFIYLKDKGFAVPPPEFNRIFILTHIYRHFLFEGIGLRQVMDYYFVLRTIDNGQWTIDNYALTLEELQLTRFAEAMMWILHTQFGLEEKYLICGMNEKEGRFVLSEILETGNFGRGDRRYHFKRMKTLQRMTIHGMHLLLHYPSEVIWTPIWLIYHKVWKWNMRRKLKP